MLIGHGPIDTAVVVGFTIYCAWILTREPVKLFSFLPAALSLYFFIPSITLVTLWQTVPGLLFLHGFLRSGFTIPKHFRVAGQIVAIVALFAFLAPFLLGGDASRALIRLFFYVTLFSLFSFSFKVGRNPNALRHLINGLVVTGLVYSLYGLYQLVAAKTGLPVRGIVHGVSTESVLPIQGFFVRINSFASEPKRLGYVLFVAALAAYTTARVSPLRRRFELLAVFFLSISILTFSTSYYAALATFFAASSLIYPKYIFKIWPILLSLAAFLAFFNADSILDAIQSMVDARLTELEIGMDGRFVYRQEFFAVDFIRKNLSSVPFGLGLGQYFRELTQAYGPGVGIGEDGRTLLPLNSLPLELVFDLGAIVVGLVYAWIIRTIFILKKTGEDFLALSLLFLLIQSYWINTALFLSLYMGLSCARLENNPIRFRSLRNQSGNQLHYHEAIDHKKSI